MLVRRIARAALGAYFINEAVKNFQQTSAQAENAAPFVEFVSREASGKVPNDPKLFVQAQGALMGLGGAALVTGKFPRAAAYLLTPAAAANAYMHEAFWAEKDPTVRAQKQSSFFRTVAITGGVLLAAADTEGKPGLAWRAAHSVSASRRELARAAKTARREAKLLTAQAGNALPS